MNPTATWPITYRFIADHPALAREFSTLLGSRGFVPASGDCAAITITFTPAGETIRPKGHPETMFEWGGLRATKQAEQILFAYQSWRLELDLATFTLRCCGPAPDPTESLVFREAFLLGPLLFLIHRLGYFDLHAGACTFDGSGYLLIGPSGSGKTTTVLSLIRSGWKYLSDDTTIVSNGSDGQVTARALRRSFSVKPDHVARHPELDACATECVPGTDKRRFDPTQLWPEQYASEGRPAFIIACTQAGDEPTSIQPIPRAEALARLIRSAPFMMFDKMSAPAHLDILRSLAARCYSFELKAGRDVLQDGNRIASLIAPNMLREQWLSMNRSNGWA